MSINHQLKKIFFALFFSVPVLALFSMTFFWDTEQKSSTLERRTLEPPIHSFVTERHRVEKYLTDHVPFRDKLLSFYFKSGLSFDFGTSAVLIGKNGWLFQNHNDIIHNLPAISAYQNLSLFSNDQLQKIADNLSLIQKWCDDNQIGFYLILIPEKHRVYSRFMPSYILRKNQKGPLDTVAARVPENVAKVVLSDYLIQQAKISFVPLYYKTDAHWSEDGAFLAYSQLMAAIQKDFPDIHILTPKDFYIEKRNDCWLPYAFSRKIPFEPGRLSLPGMDKNKEKIYNHYIFKNKEDVFVVRENNFRYSDYSKGYPLRVLIVGDSFATYLHPFLSATFSHVDGYRFNESGQGWGIRFQDRQKEMKKNKINVFILAVSELKLKDLLDIF